MYIPETTNHRKEGITVARSTEHPSSMFGTAARAFRLLENLGVNVLAFLQRIIDDTKFRRELVELISPTKQYEMPKSYHPDGVGFLNAAIRSHHEKFGSGARMRLDQGNIGPTFAMLEPRLGYIFALRYGLYDGQQMSYVEVGKNIGVSGSRVSELLKSRGFRELYKAYCATFVAADIQDIKDAPIQSLNLNERTLWCFERAQIHTIGDLLQKTEEDLLAIVNFGIKCLDETVAALEKLDLRLAG